VVEAMHGAARLAADAGLTVVTGRFMGALLAPAYARICCTLNGDSDQATFS
jgi:hypothetical protein